MKKLLLATLIVAPAGLTAMEVSQVQDFQALKERITASIRRLKQYEQMENIEMFFEFHHATIGLINIKNQVDALPPEEASDLYNLWDQAVHSLATGVASLAAVDPWEVSQWVINSLAELKTIAKALGEFPNQKEERNLRNGYIVLNEIAQVVSEVLPQQYQSMVSRMNRHLTEIYQQLREVVRPR